VGEAKTESLNGSKALLEKVIIKINLKEPNKNTFKIID
jgi:hypothetical protein